VRVELCLHEPHFGFWLAKRIRFSYIARTSTPVCRASSSKRSLGIFGARRSAPHQAYRGLYLAASLARCWLVLRLAV
jgi:hypothetical protein